MGIQFSKQQRAAIDVVHKRVRDGEPVTRMFGYAGTGKTSCAMELASTARRPLFAAFTGKAASVLSRKGCPASTIHSLIYQPSGDVGAHIAEVRAEISRLEAKNIGKTEDAEEDAALPALRSQLKTLRKQVGSPGFVFRPELSPLSDGCDLLVLDEVSMVDDKIARDLLSFEVPILALGDPAQLPPVGGNGYFTRGGEEAADALLTKVERHDGAVIDLATAVRENQRRPELNGATVRRKVGQSVAAYFDQVLVGTNKTRWAKNRKLRALAGHDPDKLLSPGDRIICLSNNLQMSVLNGQQFVAIDVRDGDEYGTLEARIICECDPYDHDIAFSGTCAVCGWTVRWIPIWEHGFRGIEGENELKEMPFYAAKKAMWATYAYAITVHKSQGSEWGKVLIVDESTVFRKDGWRWMYTAITRAQSEVLVLR